MAREMKKHRALIFNFKLVHFIFQQCSNLNCRKYWIFSKNMIKAEVQRLQGNDLTQLDYDARYAVE